MSWLQLRSGSDVRGTAVGEDANLTPEVASALGMAFARYLARQRSVSASQITVSIGRDSRVSGPELLGAAAEGVRRAGASVLDFGLCSTPAMYMSTITEGVKTDGAIMITASHHPWMKNGLKFFVRKGGLEGSEIEILLKEAEQLRQSKEPITGKFEERAFLPVYKGLLADRIRKGLVTDETQPLKGLHIAVDAGNGAGGFYEELLRELGASTAGSQFLDPDGHFPNHIPNPENPEAMDSIRKAVLDSHADLGVIFDTDCDRAAVVGPDGKEINRNRLIALISAILLAEEPGQTIVTDSVTSSGLKDFIQRHGGVHYRYKRGYRNVIDEAVRLNNEGISCPLAIETSGHAAMRENYFLDDGMYLVTVLIVKAMQLKKEGKTLSDLISDLREPAESAEIRLQILAADFRAKGDETIRCVTEYAETEKGWHVAHDNREGIRISLDPDGCPDGGWFLLRLSVHDPVLPLNVESDVPGGVKWILRQLYSVLEPIDGIDLNALRQALE